MFPAFLGELLTGLGMLASAILGGYWLIGLSRRRPDSLLVNEGVVADIVCVGEVILLVAGVMLMVRGFVDMV